MKMASSRNVPCWYQGCALDSQEDRSSELISHGSVKMRSINEATAGWQSSPGSYNYLSFFLKFSKFSTAALVRSL
jgi:hypothetical protein